MRREPILAVFLLLFTVSGFAGLIYESIWSHYLKLFLGHAAYAQTLVLAIFMGGMALGSWITSRGSRRWPNLLLVYALVEGVIGLLGVVFHGVFVGTIDFAYASALPALQSPLLAGIFKWSIGTLLILPQSILLGMTFPLMSAGLIRRFPATPGATLAMLYFTNSIGAAAGVLVSGFVLIDVVGLPGTILTAGLINVALAIVVWALIKGQPAESRPAEPAAAGSGASTGWYRLLLVIALVTGLSSFMYEIGWIRMLSLVLGAATHSFELMLSAFILGLALGGLWIRKRIDAAAAPERFLAIVQIAMGGFALLSVPLYNYTFDVMHWLMQTVQRNDGGYQLFNLTSHAIAMAVMLPATFCAGMTLPLITYALLRRGHGEKSIGAVYAANTAGAITGIFLAVHLAMPLLGLKGVIVLGAALDIALGLILIWRLPAASVPRSRRSAIAWTAAGMAAVTGAVLFAGIDPLKAASGVYRHGQLATDGPAVRVLYHQDGKTASVDLLLVASTSQINILTNGKPDASVQLDARRGLSVDEPTMVLTAALPMLYHPQARNVAVIGMGSGITSNTFLANPSIAGVDTIEIEPAMIEGAKGFRPRNERVYSDPRSRIHIEDAKTFFSTHNRQYDIIASEPSNPWVSGVASLFSDEFYRHARRHLRDDGLLVQWIQAYEIDTALVVSVLNALGRHFPDYTVYLAGYSDVIVVAKKNGQLGEPMTEKAAALGLTGELAHISIHNSRDLRMRRIASRATLEPLFATWGIPFNSDYFPILDQHAVRSRFLNQNANDLAGLANAPLPLLEMLGERQFAAGNSAITPHPGVPRSQSAVVATALLGYFTRGDRDPTVARLNSELRRNADYLRFATGNCSFLARTNQWEDVVFELALIVNSHLTPAETSRFWAGTGLDRCTDQMNTAQRNWYALYKAVGARDAAAMARLSTDLLKTGGTRNATRDGYLLSAGMLGHLAAGNRPAASDFWKQYTVPILENRPPNLALRLLAAHSRVPVAKSPEGDGANTAADIR